MSEHLSHLRYAVITPARNEEAFIHKMVESMAHQTVLPVKWVIVNDGSTDATASIIGQYLRQYDWIELVELPVHRDRSFAGKVHAFNAGYERLKDCDYELIANLDADVTFLPDYFEFLLNKFAECSSLGVAGTVFREDGYSSETDSYEGQNHVAGGCQVFRRQCFEVIGGYVPNKAGGIDWIAVTTARMMGWTTRSYRERWFFHHRKLGTAERGLLASAFSYGEKDYYLGGHPIWELCRVGYRITKKPYLIGALALLAGYSWALLRQINRPVSNELMKFHRKEQMQKLKAILRSLVTSRSVDTFQITPSQPPSK